MRRLSANSPSPEAGRVRRLHGRCTLLAVNFALSFCAAHAWAQTAPDAGSVRQQIEQQRELPMPPPVQPQRPAAVPDTKPKPGVTLSVKTFRFAGNTLLSGEQLARALDGFLNRPLRFEELQTAADAAAAAYREAGWIARVYLPEQDVNEGTVTLQVVEARFAGVRAEGELSRRVIPSEIEAYFLSRQAVGMVLSSTALDRALLLADDLPGVSVAGTLAPGESDGETALVLKTTDEPFVYGDITADNAGARSTGSERLMVNMNLNSPGGRGELVSLNLLHTQGSDYVRVGMTVPLNHDGLRLGVSASSMTYRVISGSSTAVKVNGSSGSLGLDLSYPLLRAREHNLYLTGALEGKTFFTGDTLVRSDYETHSLRAGLSGNRFDSWGGSGANSGALQFIWGRLASMQAHTLLDSIERTYEKLSYNLTRQQTLTRAHSLFVSLSGQHATQVLDSSEKFYIGGANSVRAYPLSELGGDRGQVLTGEWRWLLSPGLLMSTFADVGRVVSLPATTSDQETTMFLRGYGMSFSWQAPMGVTTKLIWSHRQGVNPKPTSTGTDGDGTLRINRVWLSASVSF